VAALPGGAAPTAQDVLRWAANYPAAGPLLRRDGQAKFLFSSAGAATGVGIAAPNGGGAVNVYLKSGKVVIAGNMQTRPWLLNAVLEWTRPADGPPVHGGAPLIPNVAALQGVGPAPQ
jgi:hypothetical protein